MAHAAGESVITEASELRVKESDRIQTTLGILQSLGAKTTEQPDGFTVSGQPVHDMRTPTVDAGLDHRIAMASVVAGLPLSGETVVHGANAINSSFPTFMNFEYSVTKRLTIAIDGPASSGKGTVARSVARALDYAYIDTGAMYRSSRLPRRVASASADRWISANSHPPHRLAGMVPGSGIGQRRGLVRRDPDRDQARAPRRAVHPEVRRPAGRQRPLRKKAVVMMERHRSRSAQRRSQDHLDASVDERLEGARWLIAKGLLDTSPSGPRSPTATTKIKHQEAPPTRTDDAVQNTTSLSADVSAQRIGKWSPIWLDAPHSGG